jgi:hypothetical protein
MHSIDANSATVVPVQTAADVLTIALGDIAVPCRDQRVLYERILVECGVDPSDVSEVRISDCGIEIDVVDFEATDWPLHTLALKWDGPEPRRAPGWGDTRSGTGACGDHAAAGGGLVVDPA